MPVCQAGKPRMAVPGHQGKTTSLSRASLLRLRECLRNASVLARRRRAGRRGVRSQDGTAAVWAPSLLARLEKLIIEFLSLPSPPCSSAEKHPGSQPCPFTVTLPANSAQEFLQALCTWKKGWGGVSRDLGRRARWSLQFKNQISSASPVNPTSHPQNHPAHELQIPFHCACFFLQLYRLISLF